MRARHPCTPRHPRTLRHRCTPVILRGASPGERRRRISAPGLDVRGGDKVLRSTSWPQDDGWGSTPAPQGDRRGSTPARPVTPARPSSCAERALASAGAGPPRLGWTIVEVTRSCAPLRGRRITEGAPPRRLRMTEGLHPCTPRHSCTLVILRGASPGERRRRTSAPGLDDREGDKILRSTSWPQDYRRGSTPARPVTPARPSSCAERAPASAGAGPPHLGWTIVKVTRSCAPLRGRRMTERGSTPTSPGDRDLRLHDRG